MGVCESLLPVTQVYSSLAEHRESVPPYTVYRPPVGSFVSPSNYAPISVGASQQQALLQSYRPYLVMKDGKLTLGSPNRFSSFSFHQPPIFVVSLHREYEKYCGEIFWRVISRLTFCACCACTAGLQIHKVERICNGLLVRRYLHERSMLLLMNVNGGCSLDEAIPNPILKVRVHPTQASSLMHGALSHACLRLFIESV